MEACLSGIFCQPESLSDSVNKAPVPTDTHVAEQEINGAVLSHWNVGLLVTLTKGILS